MLVFFRKSGYEDKIQYTIAEKKEKKTGKAHVNSVFFKQLRQLLRKWLYFRQFFFSFFPGIALPQWLLIHLFVVRSHSHSGLLDHRDGPAVPGGRVADRPLRERHLDDPERDGGGEHHHSHEPHQVQDGTAEVSDGPASGKVDTLPSPCPSAHVVLGFQISVVTNVLKWSLGELKLRFRTNLTHHLYSQYLK